MVNLGLDRRIIFKWIIKKWDGRAWSVGVYKLREYLDWLKKSAALLHGFIYLVS